MKKQISPELTASNIDDVLQLLRETHDKLSALSQGLSDRHLREPLGPGERSFTETLAHILHCEALTSQAIYLALLIDEPLIPNIHPERDLGKLIRLDLMTYENLLAYFELRRTILLRVLEPLTEKKWSRVVREEKKQRKESVYWQARGQALHELEHVLDLEEKLSRKPFKMK
jgi:hypothetical protein